MYACENDRSTYENYVDSSSKLKFSLKKYLNYYLLNSHLVITGSIGKIIEIGNIRVVRLK